MSEVGDSRLRQALENLAADPAAQESYVRQIGTWPSLDELALDLEDLRGLSDQAPAALRDQLRTLDQALDAMSGEEQADLWQVDALERAEWRNVRKLAADALATLG